MNEQRFSERQGLRTTSELEISIRSDAPYEFRGVLVDLAYECGMRPNSMRTLVCRILRKRPDPNNWSEFPNVDQEVHCLVDDCDWYYVYDIAEAIAQEMEGTPPSYEPERFSNELNAYFITNGIGWKLVNTLIEAREPEALESTIAVALTGLQGKAPTAQNELTEALRSLSRRPEPDITGAIQHAMASLECLSRQLTGDSNGTLGEILKRYPESHPSATRSSNWKALGLCIRVYSTYAGRKGA